MDLWATRNRALEILAGEFAPQAKALEDLFMIIDECIELFDDRADSDDFCRICGLTLAKARHLALGAYGLILDGLGQEAGALIRPFIEYQELLTYYRMDARHVQQAINDDLPTAGKVAQLIQGYSQDVREYFNNHASHSSFSVNSIGHLFDMKEMKIRKEQPMLPHVLFRNMGYFYFQLLPLSIEAVNCLKSYQLGYAEDQANRILDLWVNGKEVFRL